jgi:hypothetical protein
MCNTNAVVLFVVKFDYLFIKIVYYINLQRYACQVIVDPHFQFLWKEGCGRQPLVPPQECAKTNASAD